MPQGYILISCILERRVGQALPQCARGLLFVGKKRAADMPAALLGYYL